MSVEYRFDMFRILRAGKDDVTAGAPRPDMNAHNAYYVKYGMDPVQEAAPG